MNIVWLSRRANGTYMVTKDKPIEANKDLYVPYGDPIGIMHLCYKMIHNIVGRKLHLLESIQIEWIFKVIE